MQVILLENLRNLGSLGDTVKVKSGYGRNYLIPQGKAVFATKDNIAMFETRRAELEAKAAERLAEAQARADKITALSLSVAARAADEGKLFGSIGISEIIKIFADQDVEVIKREISLPNGPIHEIGEHEIALNLHPEVTVKLTVNVTPEA